MPEQELTDTEARVLLEMVDRSRQPKWRGMTREQAEANWIWDPENGDIRPKEWPNGRRPRCTDRNIEAQQSLARPGTLIHTSAETDCPRKAAKTDQRTEPLTPAVKDRLTSQPRRSELALSQGTITHTAVAGFIDNVNCLWCRRDYFPLTAKETKTNGK